MLSANTNWTWTLVFAILAVAFATVGLGLNAVYPGATPMMATALLAASLGCTATAFTRVALRVRLVELENEGLIEEISQEFDRVKDKIEIFSEALAEPRSITPEEVENVPLRRVTIR